MGQVLQELQCLRVKVIFSHILYDITIGVSSIIQVYTYLPDIIKVVPKCILRKQIIDQITTFTTDLT